MRRDKHNKPTRITKEIKRYILTMAVTHDLVAENLVKALRWDGEGNYEGLVYDEQKDQNFKIKIG